MTVNAINQIQSFPVLPDQSHDLDALKAQFDQASTIINKIVNQEVPATPFDFEGEVVFSYRNAIFALGNAINGLLSVQPELIATEMQISTDLVSPQIDAWSQAYLKILKNDEYNLSGANLSQAQIAQFQGQMSVDNAASTASSTALNGVLSMLTSGTSSKTSTYQSLIQQVSSVVTALLNAMTQNWQ